MVCPGRRDTLHHFGRRPLATPTREKYRSRLDNHILPRWKTTRIGEFRSKEILDWLQHECTSWHMMIDLRNIMSGIFARAQEWEILGETFANPMARVKVGRKWTVRPDRIPMSLSFLRSGRKSGAGPLTRAGRPRPASCGFNEMRRPGQGASRGRGRPPQCAQHGQNLIG